MTGKPSIICVAITGSLPQKFDNPAMPISVQEQVESTQEGFEAGAAIAHCHVRNADGSPSADPDRFMRLQDGLRNHCPRIVVQFSTGGQSGAGQARRHAAPASGHGVARGGIEQLPDPSV